MSFQGKTISRREFLTRGTQAAAGGVVTALVACAPQEAVPMLAPMTEMKLGLVTYLWGKDWNLPTLIRHCQQTGVLGIELRTEQQPADAFAILLT